MVLIDLLDTQCKVAIKLQFVEKQKQKNSIHAYLGDIAGSVLDHCNKANHESHKFVSQCICYVFTIVDSVCISIMS